MAYTCTLRDLPIQTIAAYMTRSISVASEVLHE
jgi:hypothetical protein